MGQNCHVFGPLFETDGIPISDTNQVHSAMTKTNIYFLFLVCGIFESLPFYKAKKDKGKSDH